ncbi:biopolymer transporter ExbD [Mucilaginibacter sp. RS28]|uniref:Biopolymer transporter ExbD n=1 Tax=Mucilaginibacter straminoryzae TaxID=2932774 RepID=A0A9X2B9M0_9SPHI|nr:biopolymer transporter ExbD [Mucilaginibacter straminoryzae]MCJ8210779.1 biopolymer transporter ExbD [Mucilaginibacter straminoryzae]
MAELDTSSDSGKGGKVRSKKASTRVDLTAMVDLAFLLITFFMLTTTLNKPQAMDLAMPDKDEKQKDNELAVAASRTMTILLGSNDKVEWYVGEPGKSTPTVEGFGKNQIRKSLLDNIQKIKASTGKDMFVIIKPSDKSIYRNMVDILDEMHITNVQSYGIVDISQPEVEELKKQNIY